MEPTEGRLISLGLVTIMNNVENWDAYLALRASWKTLDQTGSFCLLTGWTMSLSATTLGSTFCNHPSNDVLCFYAVPYGAAVPSHVQGIREQILSNRWASRALMSS